MPPSYPPASFDRALSSIGARLGDDQVRTDLASREAYARDESEAEPVLPGAVILARSEADVVATLRAAHAHGVPVTPRGGGTGRAGGAVPRAGGLLLAFEGFDKGADLSPADATVTAGPGLRTGALHAAVEAEGWLFPPDPNAWERSLLGGNIATNAGGPRAFGYGVTGDYVLGLRVVLADGTALFLGRRTKKGVTGYDLKSLIVGSEGTLAVVTEAILRLVPLPEAVGTLLAFLPSVGEVAGAVRATLAARERCRAIELLDGITLDLLRRELAAEPATGPRAPELDAGVTIPEGAGAMLLVEIDGEEAGLPRRLERLGEALLGAGASSVRAARSAAEREALWAVRREMSRTLRRQARFKLSEDIVVPRSKMAELLARARAISERHAILMPTYGHAGDGNLHVNFLWDEEGRRGQVEEAVEALLRATVELGGTLTGEHGLGVLKAPYLGLEQPPALIALQRAIKDRLDPRGVLNPGKIFPPAGHGPC